MRAIVVVHVPKAGGSSLLLDLGRAYSATELVERGPNLVRFRSRRHADVELYHLGHDTRLPEAMTLTRLKQQLPHAIAVSLVRDPYRRLFSAFRYLERGGKSPADAADAKQHIAPFHGDFRRFVIEGLGQSSALLQQVHLRTQSSCLCNEEGRLLVEHVGRLESIEASYQALGDALGISLPRPSRVNCSQPREEPYDDEMRAIVARVYAEDFERLGYAP
jgi:hypothetical protein